jgi:ring-1,2-phenylacetyl-CoA epoxidase subunit PaaD
VVIDSLEAKVWTALADVADPEIPTISVVDLGFIRSVAFDGPRLTVELLPTFVGCPAVEIMQRDITERLHDFADEVVVEVSFAEPWTSDRISAEGRERLRSSGFAPPVAIGAAPLSGSLDELTVLPIATCPYCGSRNTTLENPFGPTLCRAIYHCADCSQPFEQFKTV